MKKKKSVFEMTDAEYIEAREKERAKRKKTQKPLTEEQKAGLDWLMAINKSDPQQVPDTKRL